MNNPHQHRIKAILGPTNTGKTHYAIERLCAHSSGIMGFPLRLLAREVYDRVVAIKGERQVALITGEEKIWPEGARYLLCTAEAMPLDQSVSFVALDEAQLGQDAERGHIFTARMMEARGRDETLILGSGALTPMVRALLPSAEIISRPRFSTLRYDGPKKLSRLPKRSAIVAFSADEVYAVAEMLRRQAGGAAIVMGALSPQTRNAQVELFQSGEVDYLVATDAIGMGLNLDLTHVAFASLNKFDGRRNRRLTLPEMSQIAGRAGRHQRDGTFGSVGSEAMFTDEEIAAIEAHELPPIDWMFWRNPHPDTSSVAALIHSLETPPPHPMLRPAPESIDLAVLRRLGDDSDLVAAADRSGLVDRLWSVCALPDFRKTGVEQHAVLVRRLWTELSTGPGHIDGGWINTQLDRLDNIDGDVDALSDRMSGIRTISYIAHRADWVAAPGEMAQRARLIESRLSDALHMALTRRFVDRRTSILLRDLGQGAANLPVVIDDDGAVRVDGELIGSLHGFAFRVDPAARAGDQKMLLASAERHLAREYMARTAALGIADDSEFALVLGDGDPAITWRGARVATLHRGRTLPGPQIKADAAIAQLDPHLSAAILARVSAFVDGGIARELMPLLNIAAASVDPAQAGAQRALFAQLLDAGGVIERSAVDDAIRALDDDGRRALRRFGYMIGSLDVWHPLLLKPAAVQWRAALISAWTGQMVDALPKDSAVLVEGGNPATMRLAGFRQLGLHWLRIDMAERIAREAHHIREQIGREQGKAKAAAPASSSAEPAEPAEPAEAASLPTDGAAAASGTAPSAASAPPLPGFLIPPDFGTSLGLDETMRHMLLQQMGFRKLSGAGNDTRWTWTGRRRERPAGYHRQRRQKPDHAQPGLAQARNKDGAPLRRDSSGARSGPKKGDQASTHQRSHQRQADKRHGNRSPRHHQAKAPSPNSPFAGLADLLAGKGDDPSGNADA